MNSVLIAQLLALVLGLAACGEDKKDEEEQAAEDQGGVDPISGAQPDQASGNTGGGGTSDIDNDAGQEECGDIAEGASASRTRYREAAAVAGLSACESEEQEVTCVNGVLSASGTFTEESCVLTMATVAEGDILVLREESGTGIGDAGQVMAFSADGDYKGYAFDPEGLAPWYGYGLRLSFDYFSGEYHIEMGSSNADLAIAVQRFPTVTEYPYVMSDYTSGAASDALYFQGAFSEEYNSVRYVATADGTILKVYVFGTEVPACQIAMPNGKHARALFNGTQSFFYDGYVAYTLGTGVLVTGYGVARLNGSCSSSGGTPESLVTLFEETFADAKITSLLQVRTEDGGGAGSWKNDMFVTVGAFLYGQSVVRWHYDSGSSTWVKQDNPFEDTPKQIYQDKYGDVYTIEVEDLWDDVVHLRRYSTMETNGTHLVSTLYSDETQTILRDTSLGQWLIVAPNLD